MSDMNDAFWHKGQRNMVGSRVFGTFGLAHKAGSSADVKTVGTTSHYSIASTGGIYNMAACATIALSGGSSTGASERDLLSLHSNNPKIEYHDDSQTTARITRQTAVGLSIADDEHVYILLTVDKDGGVRGYAGEMVGITSTAKRPQLNLADEACWGQIYIKNETGSAFVVGTGQLDSSTGDGVTVTYTNLSFPPSD